MGDSNIRPIMNLANSIVGVSILAMPYCFSQCGILLGTILLVSCTFFTAWSCKMLMRAAIMTHNHSYENLALGVYGSLGKFTTGISIIGLNLGTCIAFFVIIGDLAPPIVAQFFGLNWSPYTLRAFVLIAAAVLIAFPLGLLRSIDSLSGISLCSLLFYAMVTMQLFSVAFPYLSWDWWRRVSWWDNAGLLKCIPIFALAFACQTQLFVIYSALKDPTFRRISSVIDGAAIAIATLYFLVGFFGVVSFTADGVKGDVLANFDISFISQFFRLGFSLSVVVSFPLMIFPCRVSINALFFSSKALELHVQEPMPRKRFVLITASIILLTLTIAILIPNVETVLGLTGATMGCLVAFIFPSLMFLKVVGSSADYSNRAKVLALVGLCVMVLSTTVILQAEINRSPVEGDGKVRPWPKPPADLPSLPPHSEKTLPPEVPNPVKPVIPDNPPQDKAPDNIPAQADKPVEQVGKADLQEKSNPPADQPVDQVGGIGNKTKDVAGGGGDGGVAGGVAVSAGVKDMQELQKGMHQLQSRLNHLEEENVDLKERQKILENIQVDDLLQQPGVVDKVVPQQAKLPGPVEGGGGAVGRAKGHHKEEEEEVVVGGEKDKDSLLPKQPAVDAVPEQQERQGGLEEGVEQGVKGKESLGVGVHAPLHQDPGALNPPKEVEQEGKAVQPVGDKEGPLRVLREAEPTQPVKLDSNVADRSSILNQTVKTRRDLKNAIVSLH